MHRSSWTLTTPKRTRKTTNMAIKDAKLWCIAGESVLSKKSKPEWQECLAVKDPLKRQGQAMTAHTKSRLRGARAPWRESRNFKVDQSWMHTQEQQREG